MVTGLKERGQEENEERAILAAGVDGSFFQLTVLERDAVRLLRVVMQIYSQLQQQKQQEASAATAMGAGIPPATTGGFGDSQLGPHATSITYLDEDYDDDFGGAPRHEWNPEDAHIDGDALIPITTLPKGWLRRAVDRDDAMKVRFEQVARRVLDGPDGPRQQRQGQQRDAEEPREDEEEDDICDRVCRWIEELLTDAVL